MTMHKLTKEELKELLLSNPQILNYLLQIREYRREAEHYREQIKLLNERAESLAVISEAKIPVSEKAKLRKLSQTKPLADIVTMCETLEQSFSSIHRTLTKPPRAAPIYHQPGYDLS